MGISFAIETDAGGGAGADVEAVTSAVVAEGIVGDGTEGGRDRISTSVAGGPVRGTGAPIPLGVSIVDRGVTDAWGVFGVNR